MASFTFMKAGSAVALLVMLCLQDGAASNRMQGGQLPTFFGSPAGKSRVDMGGNGVKEASDRVWGSIADSNSYPPSFNGPVIAVDPASVVGGDKPTLESHHGMISEQEFSHQSEMNPEYEKGPTKP